MITRQDLQFLLSYDSSGQARVLTIYLNVDQSRAVNLNRGFEAALKSRLQGIERSLESGAERRSFSENARVATQLISEYQPDGKSVVLFLDTEKDLFWIRSFSLSMENEARWSEKPYIRPLLEVRDEFKRIGVVLTDRARARVFSVFLGVVEEHREAEAEAEVRKFDASGMDQMRSQMHFQRKADEHAKWHLKRVAEIADKLAAVKRFDRLILAGPHEVTAELFNLLSERLKKAHVGMLALSIDASEAELLEATNRLEEQVERAAELALVDGLMTAAAKRHQAVLGFPETVEALNDGRIRQIVYSGDCTASGFRCSVCDILFADELQACPVCRGEVRKVEDLIEPVLGRVFKEGGSVEHVRDQAAQNLASKGGVGAFLRF
ncbi:MAG: hypothetical protein JSU96_15955 [Acidobacteriota bacterium]|nr:MAG: hypothetical protein JSU96_15955 [Acidobacteriota bacterium]